VKDSPYQLIQINQRTQLFHFFAALTVFLLSHSMISRGKLRDMLVLKTGEARYLVLYSLLSLILLGWLITAAIAAPRIILWPWAYWTYWIPNILMPFAFILFTAGLIAPNPLSVSLIHKDFNPQKPNLTTALTRHPVMWGFLLWSAAHIPPNGEFPVGFMFFLFTLFALAGFKLIDRKYIRKLGKENWTQLSKNTRILLFSAPAFRNGDFTVSKYDILGIGTGITLYVLFYSLHGYFFGITPLPPL